MVASTPDFVEAEHDGREPDEDMEPSIAGSTGIAGRFETDLESDGMEDGDLDESDADAGLCIEGRGYHL